MNADRWKRVSDVYGAVLDCPPAERAKRMADLTADDPSLRPEVEALVRAADREGPLDRPVFIPDALSMPQTLTVGTVIGPYAVEGLIGAGGMGEVYAARDTKLGRRIALKVLPGRFADDGDRLARFRREAQLLAVLQHPHIASIYGLEEDDGIVALALEYVDGPTLDELLRSRAAGLTRGADSRGLPLDDAFSIARQIGEALEAAHEQGIVHRDLKPANIKVTAEGVVKVLDFGLAKLADPAGAGVPTTASITNSPTITTPAMTAAGVILGTAAYMAPEQAKGRPADKRSDVWAFGCVLYEMLTGRRAFPGDDVADTLATILKSEPDWTALPADLPSSIRTLLKRCLEKDRRQRAGDIAAALLILREPGLSRSDDAVSLDKSRASVRRTAMAGAIAAVVIGAIGFGAGRWGRPDVTRGAVARFSIPLAEGQQLSDVGSPLLAISPDGTKIVYTADRRLYLRSLSNTEAAPVRGTDTPVGQLRAAVFSPDGQAIAFASGRPLSIRRVAASGGTAIVICEACEVLGPLIWDASGITFLDAPTTPDRTGDKPRLMRVSPEGGRPETLATFEGGVVTEAQLLPDADHVLVTVLPGKRTLAEVRAADWDHTQVLVQSLKSQERNVLIEGGASARYVATGHIVYAAGAVLFARRFDLPRLQFSGAAVPVVEGVRRSIFARIGGSGTPTAHYDISATGTLVYFAGRMSPGQRDLAVLNVDGDVTPLNLAPRAYDTPRVSPDGRWIAVNAGDGRDANIWLHDLSGATATRQVTSGGQNRFPVWSADGQRLAFQSDREGDLAIWTQPADGRVAPERLTRPDRGIAHTPNSWSPDGKTLLFEDFDGAQRTLWSLAIAEKKITRFGLTAGSPLTPFDATFSPTGNWVAYRAPAATPVQGASAVFIEPFPSTGERHLISGYIHPVWSRSGKELFVRRLTTSDLVVMSVTTEPRVAVGQPRQLTVSFPGSVSNSSARSHDIVDERRFVGVIPAEEPGQAAPLPRLELVLNWLEELQQRVPLP